VRPPDPVSGDAARRAAEAELRRAEYPQDDPGLVDRILRWFGRRLEDAFAGSAAGHAMLVFAVLVVAGVIVLAVRAGPPRHEVALRSGAGDPLAPLAAVDHRRLAAEHEAAGRWAEALREWLRAVIATIEERGVLEPCPGRTGAAIAREAGPLLPSLRDDLARAVAAFDATWFGGRPARPEDVRLAHALAEAVPRAPIEHPVATGPSSLVPPR
jgi:hypothetical protein